MKFNLFVGVLFFMLLSGFLSGADHLFFGSFFAIFLLYTAKLWNKFIFSGLKIKRFLSRDKVIIGQKIRYYLEIENKKILPVLWLSIHDSITSGINFINSRFLDNRQYKNSVFHDVFSLRWYERVRRSYEIIPQKRGVFYFGTGVATSYGLFGLFKQQLNINRRIELIVYPRILPVKAVWFNRNTPFGTKMRRGWIFQDPINSVGVRKYRTTDPLKHINWKASARHNQLETYIFNPSYDREVHVFFNGNTNDKFWLINNNIFELGIVVTASIVNESIKQGYSTGFYSNCIIRNQANYTSLPANNGIGQKERILTLLAKLQPHVKGEIDSIMNIEKKRIREGSTVIVITPSIDENLTKILTHYNKTYILVLIKIGKCKKEIKGINTYCLEEVNWNEIEKVEFSN